jgi:hypothetical protein
LTLNTVLDVIRSWPRCPTCQQGPRAAEALEQDDDYALLRDLRSGEAESLANRLHRFLVAGDYVYSLNSADAASVTGLLSFHAAMRELATELLRDTGDDQVAKMSRHIGEKIQTAVTGVPPPA